MQHVHEQGLVAEQRERTGQQTPGGGGDLHHAHQQQQAAQPHEGVGRGRSPVVDPAPEHPGQQGADREQPQAGDERAPVAQPRLGTAQRRPGERAAAASAATGVAASASVAVPEVMAPDELTLSTALALLDQAAQGEEPLGHCPQTGKPVYLKMGRFGPYVQRGDADGEEKPQNASLLKGMSPEDIDLETALNNIFEELSLPPEVQLDCLTVHLAPNAVYGLPFPKRLG